MSVSSHQLECELAKRNISVEHKFHTGRFWMLPKGFEYNPNNGSLYKGGKVIVKGMRGSAESLAEEIAGHINATGR